MIRQFAKLGLTLAAFAAAACVGLAFVNVATEQQIKINQGKQLNDSLKDLFAEADKFEDVGSSLISPDAAVKFEAAYLAKRGPDVLGLAIKGSGSSYGGVAVLLVGVSPDRRLVGVRVLDNKDTPGLGANASVPTYFVDKSSKTTFPGQFTGKSLGDTFEVKKDVVTITASTITSKAMTKIIKTVGDAGIAWLEKTALGGK